MWLSAIRKRAQQRLRALHQAAASFRARDLTVVLGRVAAVLFCLELAYVAVGNLLLRSQLIQEAVGGSEGFSLEFGKAYTLFPGRAHVRGLALRVEDYNVQFEVAIDEADVEIAISELPFKKFHVTKLDAKGTRFRMRHKLLSIGEDAERVAAFPKIKGFADPPYYQGVRPPTVSDQEAQHDLWKIRVEHVQAAVSELWVLEYRYRGAGRARGSFAVYPTRWVQVEPAELWLDGGSLTLGNHLVAAQTTGKITCDIPDMHVQGSDGLQVLKDISATIFADLKGGKLDFLQAYLARLGSARYSGQGEFRLSLNVARGVVQPGSRVDVKATPFVLHHELATLSGDVMLNLRRDDEPALNLALSAPRMVATRQRPEPSPYLEGISGALTIEGVDLKQDLELGAAKLAVSRAHAESLAWFDRPGTSLAGSVDAGFAVSRDARRELSADARLRLSKGRVASGDFALNGDVRSQIDVFRGSEPGAAFDVRKLNVQLADASLQSGTKRSRPFDASVDGSDLHLTSTGQTSAAGNLRVRISDADALLPLVMGAPFSGITSTALDLKQLEANTAVQISERGLNVNVVDARSGNLRMRGYLSKQKSQPRGAFLLSSGPINVGVTLSNGTTEVSPFVGDGWLSSAWPRISRAAPGSG